MNKSRDAGDILRGILTDEDSMRRVVERAARRHDEILRHKHKLKATYSYLHIGNLLTLNKISGEI